MEEGTLAVPRFTFTWPEAVKVCARCRKPLLIRLTRTRQVASLTYGRFLATEKQGYCPAHRRVPPIRSQDLLRIIAPGSRIAYDLLVRVGIARFVECRQLREIQLEISQHQHGLEIPTRTIGDLAKKFVAYFQVVHEESTGALRRDITSRGGYILHIDGTCEEGSRVLLVCLDSISGQVLESRKIASESIEEVAGVLKTVRRVWGSPLAIVHDLRQSLIAAAREIFPGVAQLVCHYHLVADVGEDILSAHVDRLRRLFRRTKVRPRLGALCRSLRSFAVNETNGEHVVSSLLALQSSKALQVEATAETIQGTIHALISWILAFSHSGDGYGFPFDLPYLTLYERIVKVYGVLEEASAHWPEGSRGVVGKLRRFKAILQTVVTGQYAEEFRQIVEETERDRRIFERLRSALRICPKGGKNRRNDEGAPSTLSPRRHKRILEKLLTSLKRQIRENGPSAAACQTVVDHLEKYWEMLFGHVVREAPHSIVAPRTNNVEERLFRTIKRQCRRLHGRGHLSRDVDAMAAGTALVLNLKNPSYCETVYGGFEPERISQRFSEVDSKAPARLLESWRRERLSTRLPRRLETMSDLPQRLARFITVASLALNKRASN